MFTFQSCCLQKETEEKPRCEIQPSVFTGSGENAHPNGVGRGPEQARSVSSLSTLPPCPVLPDTFSSSGNRPGAGREKGRGDGRRRGLAESSGDRGAQPPARTARAHVRLGRHLPAAVLRRPRSRCRPLILAHSASLTALGTPFPARSRTWKTSSSCPESTN